MGVAGHGHVIVEPPPERRIAAEEIINQPLDNLAERSRVSVRVCEFLIPAWESTLLTHGRLGLKPTPPSVQRPVNLRPKLLTKLGYKLLNINPLTINNPIAKKLRILTHSWNA